MTLINQLQDLFNLTQFYATNDNYKIVKWPDDNKRKLPEKEIKCYKSNCKNKFSRAVIKREIAGSRICDKCYINKLLSKGY